MDINQYLQKADVTQSEFAQSIGVAQSFLWQVLSGRRPVPVERCADIERATGGAVTRRDLRPDDWHRIWPELAQKGETEHA